MSELRWSYDPGIYMEERVGPHPHTIDLDALIERLADMEARLARLEKLVEVTP